MYKNDGFVEATKFEENNCKPVVTFEGWMIQVLNYHENVDVNHFTYIERHFGTDEVFVLMLGEAHLVWGSDMNHPGELKIEKMEQGIVYNVKKNVWHFVISKEGASVLVVENSDTTWDNSEKYRIDADMKGKIRRAISVDISSVKSEISNSN